MDDAWLWSRQSTCPRLSVGAVLVWGGRVFAQGYNGAPAGIPHCDHPEEGGEPCQTAVHAELNAIINAAFHGASTQDATIYTTHSPCRDCAGAIINAGIVAVVYEMDFREDIGLQLLRARGLEVYKL